MTASGKSSKASRAAAEPAREGDQKRVLPVVEEQIAVSRVTEKTGRAVRVRIESHSVTERLALSGTVDEVSVERIPVNRYVDERSAAREEADGVLVIPVFETVPVVEMRLLLKEEIRIVRRRRAVQSEEEVVLRKDVPVVERRESEQDEWHPDPPEP